MPLLEEMRLQPRPRICPATAYGRNGDAEHFGCFLEGKTDEIAEFHQLRLLRIASRERIQRIVHGEGLIFLGRWGDDLDFVDIDVFGLARATLVSLLSPGAIDQDAAHRLSRGGEKVRPIIEAAIPQPKPGLVYQAGRLNGLARPFVCHLLRGHPAQLRVDRAGKLFRSRLVPIVQALED